MAKYKVKSPILHDGKHYGVGEKIELKKKAAKPIVHCLEEIPSGETGNGKRSQNKLANDKKSQGDNK